MKKFLNVLLSAIFASSVVAFSSCAQKETGYNGSELYFSSSDESLAAFLNDFYSRHIRNGDDAIGAVKMGCGETYQKLWEADSIVWFDSTVNGLGTYDAMENIRSWITNITIDRTGYVYSAVNTTHEEGTRAWMGYGWPFPGYSSANNNGAERSLCYGENFSDGAGGWTVNGIDGVASPLNKAVKYLEVSFNGKPNENLILQSPEIGKNGAGIDTTLYSNMIEFELLLEDVSSQAGMVCSDIEDLYIEWRTAESREEHGDDYWFEVSQKEFACAPEEFSSYTMLRTYFPMYLNADWDGKHVTDVRIVLKPKAGKSLSVFGKMNYFYFMGDNSNTVNVGNFIETLEKYVTFNNDTELLKNQITRARRAILYELYVLNGKKGYTDLSCYRGRALTQDIGYLNQNGFWDMYPTGNRNAESDAYFYIALKSLARLERFLSDAGISVDTEASISYIRDGKTKTAVYDETAESLDALAEKVKDTICKNISEGGFWNPETGRFAWAIYDDQPRTGMKGGAMDYGHTELNLLLIYYGIPTAEQSASIFSWLDGERTVDGDTSTGEDIYLYEFAPRSTTRQNNVDHNSMWAITNGNQGWATSCQNGGTCLFIAYYDLLARADCLGIENAYKRIKSVEKWYEEVLAIGGQGYNFYDEYYLNKFFFDETGNPDQWTVQGSGSNGAIGIPGEFYESATLYATIPYMFFGLSASEYNTLSVSPELPAGITWFQLDNLRYSDITYSCKIEKNKVVIDNVKGEVKTEAIKITLKKPSDRPTVKINGKKTDNYRTEGDCIVVEIPFGSAEVSVS